MQAKHQAHHNELDACLVVLQNTKDIVAKSALWKFYNNLRLTWVALDNEMIECRRRGRVTSKYTELEVQFAEHCKNFEHWQIMAALLY
jgi:hypothetical protein